MSEVAMEAGSNVAAPTRWYHCTCDRRTETKTGRNARAGHLDFAFAAVLNNRPNLPHKKIARLFFVLGNFE